MGKFYLENRGMMLPFICAFLLLRFISDTEEPVSERANYNMREDKREPPARGRAATITQTYDLQTLNSS